MLRQMTKTLNMLDHYKTLMDEKWLKVKIKSAKAELERKVIAKYAHRLSIDEIKMLVVAKKWLVY